MAKWIRLSSLDLPSVGSIPVMSNLFLYDFLGNLLFEVSKHLTLSGVRSGMTLCSEGGQFDHNIF